MEHLFRHIVVPLDQSVHSEAALDPASELALTFGARLSLLRVIEPDRVAGEVLPPDPMQGALHRAQALGYLRRLTAGLAARGVQAEATVVTGDPSAQVMEHVRQRDADLLVFTRHGQGGADLGALGGEAGQVLLQARVSLLLIRDVPNRPGAVLVPLDGSARAEHVLPVAQRIALARRVPLLLAHALPEPEVPRGVPLTGRERALKEELMTLNRDVMARYLDGLASSLRPDGACDVRLLDGTHPLEGLHDLILHEAVGLVVLSAHGHSGLRRWPYGRTALNLLTYAPVPVLIVQDLCAREFAARSQP